MNYELVINPEEKKILANFKEFDIRKISYPIISELTNAPTLILKNNQDRIVGNIKGLIDLKRRVINGVSIEDLLFDTNNKKDLVYISNEKVPKILSEEIQRLTQDHNCTRLYIPENNCYHLIYNPLNSFGQIKYGKREFQRFHF